MQWLVFSYTLPSKLSTASRVRIWRKLKKSGAISPKTGLHVLPYSEECLETVRWLVTEIEQEQGEALIMEVKHFQNFSDEQVIELFRTERVADYREIETFMAELEQLVQSEKEKRDTNVVSIKRNINKLKKNIDAVSRIDYFHAYDKKPLMDRLRLLQKTLVAGNLILSILFSFGALNTVVLRKMKEERYEITRRETIKIKRGSLDTSMTG